MCCNGVLHSFTWVREEEREQVQALGLTVEAREDRFAFQQPCPCHRGTHCTVYPQRPHHCQTYRCKLLNQVDEGTVTSTVAHERIDQMHAVLARIHTALGDRDTHQPTWRRLGMLLEKLGQAEDPAEARREHAAVLGDAARVELMSRSWFLSD